MKACTMADSKNEAQGGADSQPIAPSCGWISLGLRRALRQPRVLLGVGTLLLLLYALLWMYRFLVGELGPFAPLAIALIGALLLAIVGPWLVVHYRTQLQ